MKLAIVVPCYNEEEVLAETHRCLSTMLEDLKTQRLIDEGKVVYVDDGSRDATWSLITSYAASSALAAGVKLAHNAGHQHALWAGMAQVVDWADAVVTIDADLQDDVDCIRQMVTLCREGNDIVFGVRRERKTDSFFKRNTAQLFYRLMRKLGGEIVYNHADYRLMSRRAVKSLLAYPERNLFLRGLVCTLGFPTACVYYDRKERQAGVSKYPLSKMLSFAIDGITSFSVRPLRYISYLGALFMLVSLLAIVYGVYVYFKGQAIAGWTSLLVSVWFIGGAILVACGIIGEYVGKIYSEVKRRPRYLIEQEVGFQEKN